MRKDLLYSALGILLGLSMMIVGCNFSSKISISSKESTQNWDSDFGKRQSEFRRELHAVIDKSSIEDLRYDLKYAFDKMLAINEILYNQGLLTYESAEEMFLLMEKEMEKTGKNNEESSPSR